MPSKSTESPEELQIATLAGADRALYEVVAARRLQWDQLVWQVPVLSLTAQAFLFTVSLSSGNSQLARAIASTLALLAALLSMQIMARHRQAEITDAHWLRDYERANFTTTIHGPGWAAKREEVRVAWPFSAVKGFVAWMVGFAVFAVAAFAILVLCIAAPDVIS